MDQLFQSKKECRKFGMGLAAALCLAGTARLIFHQGFYLYFYFAAAVVFSASQLFPASLKPLFILFSRIGAGLGWLTTRLALVALFYFLFAPLGFLLKIIGKDFLDLKLDKKRASYWQKRKNIGFSRKDYENQF